MKTWSSGDRRSPRFTNPNPRLSQPAFTQALRVGVCGVMQASDSKPGALAEVGAAEPDNGVRLNPSHRTPSRHLGGSNMETPALPALGAPSAPLPFQFRNLTTGREKWSSDRPRSITRSGQRNSGSPGGSSGRASGGRRGQVWRVSCYLLPPTP